MGKKKGKNTKQSDENWGDESVAENLLDTVQASGETEQNPVGKGKSGGGKKNKRKKQQEEEDDIEAELLQIAKEEGIEVEIPVIPPAATLPDQTQSTVEQVEKKGKKGRKKKQNWDDDDILKELEEMSLEDQAPIHNQSTVPQSDLPVAEQEDTATNKEATLTSHEKTSKKGQKGHKGNKANQQDDFDMLKDEPPENHTPVPKPSGESQLAVQQEDSTTKEATKTPHGKKGQKGRKGRKANQEDDDDILKELEEISNESTLPKSDLPVAEQQDNKEATSHEKTSKKGHKGNKASQQEEVKEVNDTPPASADAQTLPPVQLDSIEASATTVDAGEDDKKKKKKKKKTEKPEEDKKGAKSKKPKGLLKMKAEIEALREAQRKREEEELAKQKAEEEAEQKRLEQIRIEQEKKERKKQKEKEKRERLRKEGKLLSKSEKEKKRKREMQLEALKQQGVVIPQKSEESDRKGPVRYGNKRRPRTQQQNKENQSATVEAEATPLESAEISAEDVVKDNWDDSDKENDDDDDVKDCWEDEDEDDEEVAETESVDQPLEESMVPDNEPTVHVATPSSDTVHVAEEEESEESESEDSEESSDDEGMTPYEAAARRIQKRRVRYNNNRSRELLRSPVVCVLGHVDTGKTKILDKIRHSNVQDGEAGGITQQIGATFVPKESVAEQTKPLKEKHENNLPGLLIIDTPGHESFSNLRTRGSSMCDVAILVVDIMHGLEPQTIESLNLLKKGDVPFIVALNKIDRLFDWRRNPSSSVKDTLKRQKTNTKDEFDERTKEVITQFAEQSINAALFWEKGVDFKTEYIPLVPTSAISGDGMSDLIGQVVNYCDKYLIDKLMFSEEIDALVLEVKVVAGLGTTIDVILRNGILHEGDTMILTGLDGPFTTQARALLMPQPLRELRVKNAYINHQTIIASQGVKICGKDLEKTLAGTPIFIAKNTDEIDVLKNEASLVMSTALSSFKLKERGVFVQASTLGSLEALLAFLKTSKIPYAGVNIGPVHKKDIMKASVMLDRDSQWACVLAFDVRVEREAQELADNLGVKIFTADIIYHLFDNFIAHRKELQEKKRREHEHIAIFPCKLRILPNCVFNARNPIIVGVMIEAGIVKPGTPIVVPSRDFVNLGTIISIENNHKPVDMAKKGSEVCIKIDPIPGDAPKLFGRHFDMEDLLVSKISRESIDAVKSYFREDLNKGDWQLMIELKKTFGIY